MKKIFLSLLLVLSGIAYAGCPDLYPNGKTVVIPNTIEVCNTFFVSLYDSNNRAVIAVFEKFTKGSPVGRSVRVNAFHTDSRIVKSASPSEYVNTGYDKGHMAAAQDASNTTEMYETFSMLNVTPQEPTLNGQSWKRLEMSVRKKFETANEDFHIANIAIYDFNTAKRIGKGIPVPSGYWKIVYTSNGIEYYFAENKPYASVTTVTSVDINKLIGAK